MPNFKNRIITISGEPASGKSTVINQIKEDYEKLGYKVHIFSVGHEFRRVAKEKGLSIEELNTYMMKRGNIDEIIDSAVAKRGQEINSRKRDKDIYIFDSRLAFNNIENAFSIRLTVDENIAGKRVFEDNKRGKEDSYKTVKEAIEKTKKRKETEVERYIKRYGIDIQDSNNYSLVIDTSHSTIHDISEVIEKCLELDMENKPYGKMWTSPKKLLPLQREEDTLGMGFGSGFTFEEVVEIIKKEGYDPTSNIETVKVDGKLYIIEGHHRNFALANIGKTLIPYIVLAKDNEEILKSKNTAKQRADSLTKDKLWGHEQFFDEPDKQFSYNHIYPGIFDELTKKEHQDTLR